MSQELVNRFSGPVTVFQGRRLPEPGVPAGYAALIEAYGLQVPLPRQLHAIGQHHRLVAGEGWRLLTPRHAPPNTLEGQLTFALKWEGLDLTLLKRLFHQVGGPAIETLVRAHPTSSYARRIWFLYEWLLGTKLALPDASAGKTADVLDTELQFGVTGERSSRHRVRNNLPGTPDFCPLVFRSEALARFIDLSLSARARETAGRVPADVLARAAAFLLLADSRSSFAIEGERPPQSRIERWGRTIAEAGRNPLSVDELLRLQRILIGDDRFVRLGVREEGGFVGERDRRTRLPLPEHVSARPDDLERLVDALVLFDAGPARELDPVVAAAALAFGFVYIHPFEDGNGRLHRYLMHHVLAERGFAPPGLVFPVSAVILREIDAYRAVLETHSRQVLPLVEWEPTEDFNVRVLNDTGDFYRFFDATPHAEFLYHCVQETIERDLPQETGFLAAYDRFAARVQDIADMPDATVDLLFRFLQQNGGKLSQRAQGTEFQRLTGDEVARVERIYAQELTPFVATPTGAEG